MNKENDFQKNTVDETATNQTAANRRQRGQVQQTSSLNAESDFSRWLDAELDELVQQYEAFITKGSNRNYFSR